MIAYEGLLFRSLATIGLIAIIIAALHAGEVVLVPLTLALFLALILHLPVSSLESSGVPRGLSIAIIVALLLGGLFAVQQSALRPAQDLIKDYPKIAADMRRKINDLQSSMEGDGETAEILEEAADDVAELVTDEDVQEVVVQQPSFLARAATSLARATSSFFLVIVLASFILAARKPFLGLATMFFGTTRGKLHAARVWMKVEQQVANYFLTITIINITLGVTVGVALHFADMPYAPLWGLVVALLNYMPFIGPVIGTVLLAAVSFATFDSISYALVPPLIYFILNGIEANLVTPSLVGSRLRISPVAILVSMMIWGWLWGFAGLLISVPILVVMKSIAMYTPMLAPVDRIITQRGSSKENRNQSEAKLRDDDKKKIVLETPKADRRPIIRTA